MRRVLAAHPEEAHASLARHPGAQPCQRALHGLRAHRGAVALQLQTLGASGRAAARQREPDGADRLARRRARRPGDAGDGDGKIGMRVRERP